MFVPPSPLIARRGKRRAYSARSAGAQQARGLRSGGGMVPAEAGPRLLAHFPPRLNPARPAARPP